MGPGFRRDTSFLERNSSETNVVRSIKKDRSMPPDCAGGRMRVATITVLAMLLAGGPGMAFGQSSQMDVRTKTTPGDALTTPASPQTHDPLVGQGDFSWIILIAGPLLRVAVTIPPPDRARLAAPSRRSER
jgi:hypothetical protein